MSDFPPKDYVSTKSAIEGIQVFMPRPPDEKHEEVVDFICPQCAATTAYCADNGGLTCTYCQHYEPPKQEIVGKDAEQFEFTVDTMHRVAHGWGVERKELVCNGCAAHTTFSTDMLTHTCPFCGSNQVVQIKAPQDVLRPRFLLPFEVNQDTCRQKTAVWLQDSWMLPRGLQKMARVVDYTPIYIPFWTIDSDTDATWRAEVAHTESTKKRGKGSRTETVQKWVWENGRVQRNFDDLLVAGTNKISTFLIRQMRSYNLNKLVPYEASYLAGIQAQAYDIDLEEGWEVARNRMRERVKEQCKGQATNTKMRNFSMNMNFSNESWRYILLPIYLTTYKYNNKTWQVMIHGQNGTIAGQRPVDWQRIGLVILAMLLPAIFFGVLSFVSLNFAVSSYGSELGCVAFISFVIAMGITITILSKATAMDNI